MLVMQCLTFHDDGTNMKGSANDLAPALQKLVDEKLVTVKQAQLPACNEMAFVQDENCRVIVLATTAS